MKKIIFLVAFGLAFIATTAQTNNQKGDFASLAIDSRNGEQYGWAINYTTQSDADARAKKECERNG
ncbi:MAG TPA: DUF4189 domain-containing protein, partial [Saprospiraceae bacterium]|nr:DUF4189 domain-containing protein [Saprospiraceae bacterium]